MRDIRMRMNEKGHSVTNGANQLFNVNFHDFISKRAKQYFNGACFRVWDFSSRCKAFKEAD
ncbi:hypothetical protein ACT7DM_26275 [Bacillus cereus]